MNTELHATLTRTRRGEPLATVEGLPGGGADLTPAELRSLATSLMRIAADCEARLQTKGRTTLPLRKAYMLREG